MLVGPFHQMGTAVVVRRFIQRFRHRQWPDGKRLPDIYYFPASLQESPEGRPPRQMHRRGRENSLRQFYVTNFR